MINALWLQPFVKFEVIYPDPTGFTSTRAIFANNPGIIISSSFVGWEEAKIQNPTPGVLQEPQGISSHIGLSDKPIKTEKTLTQQGYSRFYSSADSVKTWVSELYRQVKLQKYRLIDQANFFAGPAGQQFLAAFVFGSVSDIEKSTLSQLKALGLLHIASASGANVAIVVGWSEFITRIWPQRQTKFGLVMLFLGFYLVLAEFSASIVRATLGASYRLAALYLWKRPVNALWSLGVSAGLMLLVRPAYLLELSFQLSCLATLGLALFSDFSSRVTREKSLIEGFQPRTARQSQFRTKFTQLVSQCFHTIVQTLSDSFKMCLAAQVFITPYLWLKFDVFTPISLIANPSLLWMTPLITQLCLGLLMTTTWMGQRPLEVGWISLRIMGQVLNFTAQLFLSSLTLLSQLDRWLLTHHLIWGGWIGWWLLSGFLVVKTINLSAQSSDDTF